ncbi:MAG: hypothetical protein ACE366_29440 [Bradymonadia bacterium]
MEQPSSPQSAAPSSVTVLDLARAVYEEAIAMAKDQEEADLLATAALFGALRHVTPVPEMAAEARKPELRGC